MQFVKLRLQGFKSFVDPTEMVIAPGLTGVVGPNGCGKSNLLEALRWVMGETSPKAMRGGGMEDVIFAGAASRPARRFAEVALHVDDGARRAPPGFPDTAALEITRRITRDMGSAYRANGREVRARDVRMLFADAATGAHSPALVRQGMISELVNARPTARRAILEEAAGIGGLYQRRQEAEGKLDHASRNLARVNDVLEQRGAQIATLVRQARQAARYREIAGELRGAEGALSWLRWHEAARQAAADQAALDLVARAAAAAQADLTACAAARAGAQAALPPLRDEDEIARAVIQRHLAERSRLEAREVEARGDIARLHARTIQIAKDLEREEALNRDADEMMDALAQEELALRAEDDGGAARRAPAEQAARDAGDALALREAASDRLTGDAARLQARHLSVAGRLEQARAANARASDEAERAAEDVEALADEIEGFDAAMRGAAAAAAAAADAAGARADAGLRGAEAARAAAQSAESEAGAARSAAQGEARALGAETAGLRRLLEHGAGAAAQAIDQVRAAPGWEAALGAALGDDLRAPFLALGQDAATGWADPAPSLTSPPTAPPAPWPAGAEPLTLHVVAPDALARRLAHVAAVPRAAGAGLQGALAPGQRLVSREGDLWRWDGYRVAGDDAPSAAALRLQHRNRIEALSVQCVDADAAAQAAGGAHERARAALAVAAEADGAARAARRAADQRQTDAQRALIRAETDLDLRRGRLEALRHALGARRDDAADAAERLEDAQEAAEELEDLGEVQGALEAARGALAGARQALMSARAEADALRREGEARAKRLPDIARERAGWAKRHGSAGARLADLHARLARGTDDLATARTIPAALEGERAGLIARIAAAETRAAVAAITLSAAQIAQIAAETAERDALARLSACREARARAEALAEAAGARAQDAAARTHEETGHTPDALAAALGLTPQTAPAAKASEALIADLRRRRDAIGPVNLRAEEDAAEIAAERDRLLAEVADLDQAIERLRAAVAQLNAEGRARLLAAFEQVNASFGTLFAHLFGGGEASLALIESDDPLDAGLEIMAMPPGKRLSTLSLMSGGEQTLTALSLIFAVFLANPAPICVLDEVDAPLDDANVTRFCDLLDEMTRRTATRFLIITHHALTMSRMDRLFGVTMAEQGVSQLVSVDLSRAAGMVEG